MKYILLLQIIVSANLLSQNAGTIIWENKYGGIDYDEANAVVQTSSGDFIFAGYTQSYGLGRWGNAYLVRVNSNGDSAWTRNYGGDGIDVFASLTISSDSMFVGTGLTDTPDDFENIYLVKIDIDGNLQWEKNYGGASKDVAQSIITASDGGMILTGVTKSFSLGEEDLFIFKTDVNGDSLWFKTYGTAGNDGGYSIKETSDGGFIIAGSYNWSDVWLLKTNSSGDTLWTKVLGGALYDEGISVIETDDKGFLIGGSSSSFGNGELDAYMIKTDSLGNVEWQKTYGGASYDEGRRVLQRDNGYLFLANTDSEIPGEFNYFVIWTDMNGDTVLTKTYGDVGEDRSFGILDLGEYYLIAGSDFSNTSFNDASLLMIESGNKPSAVNENSNNKSYFLSNAYPNPFNPVTTIRFTLQNSSHINLKIFDLLGNEVTTLIDEFKQAGEYNASFDASGLASGTYFYKLESDNFSETKKIILMK